jgi:hypothetical protein
VAHHRATLRKLKAQAASFERIASSIASVCLTTPEEETNRLANSFHSAYAQRILPIPDDAFGA